MASVNVMRKVEISSDAVYVDGVALPVCGSGEAMLDWIYRTHVGGYPKYHKMDLLCKLGFIASELLLAGEDGRFVPRDDRAVILFNRTGSQCDDLRYLSTITEGEGYFPSPAVFVYTLPNIVTGEIAIRNKYYGETSFYLISGPDTGMMLEVAGQAMDCGGVSSALTGWVECPGEDKLECMMMLAEKTVNFAD